MAKRHRMSRGSKKRARMSVMRRHKKSKCTKIKRAKVCKRTPGCKFASGTKRKYCRRSRSRRTRTAKRHSRKHSRKQSRRRR